MVNFYDVEATTAMNFFKRCLGLDEDDEDEARFPIEDVLLYKEAVQSKWLPREYSRSTSKNSRLETSTLYRSVKASSTHSSRESRVFTLEGASPQTFKVKIFSNEMKYFNATINLELVPNCKRCDNVFDDINEVLITLLRDKVTKVLVVTIDGQQECLGCSICKKTEQDDLSMRNHLLNHIELKEILCEQCERTEKDDSSNSMVYEKNLEKVRLSEIVLNCAMCDHNILNVPFLLPEVVIIKEIHSRDQEEVEQYTCERCKCNITSNVTKTVNGIQYVSLHNIFCDDCMKMFTSTINTPESKCSGECQSSEESGLVSDQLHRAAYSIPWRQIILEDADMPLYLEISDFIIHDKSVDGAWYTCRFCGDTEMNHRLMNSHIMDHITPKQKNCMKCGFQINQYSKEKSYLLTE